MINCCVIFFYYSMLYFLFCFIAKSTEILDLKKLNIDFKNSYDFILPGFIEVTQYIEPSMELFYKEIFMPKIPAILKGKKYFF